MEHKPFNTIQTPTINIILSLKGYPNTTISAAKVQLFFDICKYFCEKGGKNSPFNGSFFKITTNFVYKGAKVPPFL